MDFENGLGEYGNRGHEDRNDRRRSEVERFYSDAERERGRKFVRNSGEKKDAP